MSKKEAIVVCSNGLIVAWHPKQPFPYANSRPINLEQINAEREKLFAPTVRKSVEHLFGKDGPNLVDLREIFYTEKHDWTPNQYLCLFEHFPVYTVGLREHCYSKQEEQELKAAGADFVRVKRGGLITFHGPGQIVAYPIFNLRNLNLTNSNFVGVRKFVELIEQTVINLLINDYKLKHIGRTEDTGVWVNNNKKIAAIGIQVSSGLTSHGVALNCNTDLQWFERIIPCGLVGKSTTSITNEIVETVTVENVCEPLCANFQKIFQLPINLVKFNVKSNEIDSFLNSQSFDNWFH